MEHTFKFFKRSISDYNLNLRLTLAWNSRHAPWSLQARPSEYYSIESLSPLQFLQLPNSMLLLNCKVSNLQCDHAGKTYGRPDQMPLSQVNLLIAVSSKTTAQKAIRRSQQKKTHIIIERFWATWLWAWRRCRSRSGHDRSDQCIIIESREVTAANNEREYALSVASCADQNRRS